MPARAEEIEHAKEEGIEFMTLCNPVEIIGGKDADGKPTGHVSAIMYTDGAGRT